MLMERGFERLRYADVARGAGVSVACLRHYFPSLAQLRMEALRAMVSQDYETLVDSLTGVTDPVSRIERIVEAMVRPHTPGDAREWLLWLDHFRAAGRDAEIAAERRASDAAYRLLCEEAIRAGQAGGVFCPGVPVEDAARQILAVVDGCGAQLAMPHTGKDDDLYAGLALRATRLLLGIDPERPPAVP